jgi:hypothetical protein
VLNLHALWWFLAVRCHKLLIDEGVICRIRGNRLPVQWIHFWALYALEQHCFFQIGVLVFHGLWTALVNHPGLVFTTTFMHVLLDFLHKLLADLAFVDI